VAFILLACTGSKRLKEEKIDASYEMEKTSRGNKEERAKFARVSVRREVSFA
jgi:hypothetical protein